VWLEADTLPDSCAKFVGPAVESKHVVATAAQNVRDRDAVLVLDNADITDWERLKPVTRGVRKVVVTTRNRALLAHANVRMELPDRLDIADALRLLGCDGPDAEALARDVDAWPLALGIARSAMDSWGLTPAEYRARLTTVLYGGSGEAARRTGAVCVFENSFRAVLDSCGDDDGWLQRLFRVGPTRNELALRQLGYVDADYIPSRFLTKALQDICVQLSLVTRDRSTVPPTLRVHRAVQEFLRSRDVDFGALKDVLKRMAAEFVFDEEPSARLRLQALATHAQAVADHCSAASSVDQSQLGSLLHSLGLWHFHVCSFAQVCAVSRGLREVSPRFAGIARLQTCTGRPEETSGPEPPRGGHDPGQHRERVPGSRAAP
jgi:hypothetical protein